MDNESLANDHQHLRENSVAAVSLRNKALMAQVDDERKAQPRLRDRITNHCKEVEGWFTGNTRGHEGISVDSDPKWSLIRSHPIYEVDHEDYSKTVGHAVLVEASWLSAYADGESDSSFDGRLILYRQVLAFRVSNQVTFNTQHGVLRDSVGESEIVTFLKNFILHGGPLCELSEKLSTDGATYVAEFERLHDFIEEKVFATRAVRLIFAPLEWRIMAFNYLLNSFISNARDRFVPRVEQELLASGIVDGDTKEEILPFDEAKNYVRKLNLRTRRIWEKYVEGALPQYVQRPVGIPSDPSLVYAESGWAGWDDWLGSSFEEGKALLQKVENVRKSFNDYEDGIMIDSCREIHKRPVGHAIRALKKLVTDEVKSSFEIGDRVRHCSRGMGTVSGFEEIGSLNLLLVDFDTGEQKKIVDRFVTKCTDEN